VQWENRQSLVCDLSSLEIADREGGRGPSIFRPLIRSLGPGLAGLHWQIRLQRRNWADLIFAIMIAWRSLHKFALISCRAGGPSTVLLKKTCGFLIDGGRDRDYRPGLSLRRALDISGRNMTRLFTLLTLIRLPPPVGKTGDVLCYTQSQDAFGS